MNTIQRHQKILEKIRAKDYVLVSYLAKRLNVSEVTIRKDLKVMEEKGLLYRNHGGASSSNPYVLDRPLSHKQEINKKEKVQIALKAIEFVEEDDVIIMGSGTTLLCMAENLPRDKSITVITSSLRISALLCNYEKVNVIQLGGDVRKSSQSTVGSVAQQNMLQFSANKLFLGIDGIDFDFGISTSNTAEAHLNRLMMQNSGKVYILSDHSKFGRKGLGKISDLEEIDYLITNQTIVREMKERLDKLGIQTICSAKK